MRRGIPVLETERLIVRPFTMDDFDGAHRILDLEAFPPGLDLDERRIWLNWTVQNYEALTRLGQPSYGDRAVTLKSGELIGSVGVVPCLDVYGQLPSFGGQRPVGAQAEVGLFWAMSTRHRKQGYATEAAQALIDHLFTRERLGRIIATTEYDNLASQGVMKKLGMRVEKNPFPEPEWLQVVGILER